MIYLKKSMLILIIIILSIITFSSMCFSAESARVLSAEIQGSISPAQVSLVDDLVDRAVSNDYDIILIRLDTPGGLGDSMRRIVKRIFSSPVPVCIWVGPSGAHAASAGAFIVASAELAAMAPGTNIGAAIPVSGNGEDLKESMKIKVRNDFSSFISSIAKKRGRNSDWYSAAVNKGVSIDANDALKLNVVDMIASNTHDFLDKIGKMGLPSRGKIIFFDVDKVVVDHYSPGFRYGILSWLLDPQIAYFLLMGGIIGLFFELSHPGAVFPGVIGGFCLFTSLYAMSILPTNAAGLLLIIFGAVLFILEIYIASYGLLSIAAVISLFVGSLILYEGGQVYDIPILSIVSTVFSFSAFAGLLIYLVTKSQLRKPVSGLESMSGLEGRVSFSDGKKVKVMVRGEIWEASGPEILTFKTGDPVVVDKADGLKLIVHKKVMSNS
ncbi:NfeD family protein [Maridesulfovibrio bastinii]|uniref:NfeD family protein n=1 Tax=Maridesulfovibrio bastinii TaxID=47157 RepID=UPI0003F834C1|nr:nodulation protein NfeD [Maridesulfovibrio bastinii]